MLDRAEIVTAGLTAGEEITAVSASVGWEQNGRILNAIATVVMGGGVR